MRIIYLHQYFRTPEMSGGTRSFEMARRLVQRGHEVHMITSNQEPSPGLATRWYETQEEGIAVHWLPVPYSNAMSFRRRMRAFAHFALAAAGRAARLGGDVVFASSTPLTIALPGIWAARCNRIPMVFEVRDLWPEMPIAMGAVRNPLSIAAARALERLAYHEARHIVALSPGMKEGIVRCGVDPDRVTVIPNSCDFELFSIRPERGKEFRRQHDWLQDRPLVVYTGTLGIVNGVQYLVRLAAECQHLLPELRWAIVGTGREEPAVRKLAHELKVLNQCLYMVPVMPKCEIPAVLSAANLAVSCFVNVRPMWHNSANKVFDALAAGRPIAINHGGWLADLIRQEDMGLVLSPDDLRDAATNLCSAIQDRAWLERAGENAKRCGRSMFDRDRLAVELERVLLEASNGGRRLPTSTPDRRAA